MNSLWVFFCNKFCWSQPGSLWCHSHGGYFGSVVQRAREAEVPAWDLPGFTVKGWDDQKEKGLLGLKGIQKMQEKQKKLPGNWQLLGGVGLQS